VSRAMLDIPLDRSSPVPLYFQVAQHLERRIESGDLPVGTLLENEVALADRLGLSRPTMRRAIQFLVDRGLLVRKRGVGTQVVRPRVRRPAELTSLYDDLQRTGQHPRTDVLSLTLVPATDALAVTLDVLPGTDLYSLRRLRFAGDEPLALMQNYLPSGRLRLSESDLHSRGLYDVLRSAGIVPKLAEQSIGARAATAAEARTLGEPRGVPLLTMERTAYDDTGRPIEHGSHVYRASLYTFEFTLSAGRS
jgi:DNA-binding GntR family transcriptional regulator